MVSKTKKKQHGRKVKDVTARGLSDFESKRVKGGTKLPMKRTPPTVVLHRSSNPTT